MKTIPARATAQVIDTEWVGFAGGELEGKRPRVLCTACRARLHREANSPRVAEPSVSTAGSRNTLPLCFQCYRAELERERALMAAGALDTASTERFQTALPLEPINHARLTRLKVERRVARARQAVASPYVDRRRQAQINARHVLQRLAEGLRARSAAPQRPGMATAQQTTELTLPEAWLPFVASR